VTVVSWRIATVRAPASADPAYTTLPPKAAMTGVPSGLLNSTPWCCWKNPPIVEP
jgi:hypothetical protein